MQTPQRKAPAHRFLQELSCCDVTLMKQSDHYVTVSSDMFRIASSKMTRSHCFAKPVQIGF